jgi:membrane protein YqaA with SNARE-associated domain
MGHFRDVLVTWGPLGVLVVSAIESAGIPNPGGTDWLLLIVAIGRPADAWLAAALAVTGSLVGTAFFYELLRKGGERYLAGYTSTGRGLRFRAWFVRYGLVTVFIPALLPLPFLPFKAFVACAGAMRINRIRFFLVLLTARVLRYSGLAFLGQQLGESSAAWLKAHLWHMGGVAAILFVGLYLLIRWSDRGHVRLDPGDEPSSGLPPEPKATTAGGTPYGNGGSGYNK